MSSIESDFLDQCNRIYDICNGLEDEYNDLLTDYNEIDSYWEGNSANLYKAALENKMQTLKELILQFESLGDELKRTTGVFQSRMEEYIEMKKNKALEGEHFWEKDFFGYFEACWDDFWDDEYSQVAKDLGI